jgi:hypothetical protein
VGPYFTESSHIGNLVNNVMSEQEKSIKDVIREEYVKAASDPIYFLKRYVYIQTSEGRMLFTPYVFQEKLLHLLNKNDRTLILKSRQLGITTLTASFALWLMIFKKDQSILALAPTQEKARNIVDKVRFAYAQLPSWLKVQAVEDNKLSLILANGSKIKAASGASESARGYTANVLILDEAAFIENAEDLWGSAQQTLATGGIAIVLSTPNGVGQWFHMQWVGAETGENNFIPIRLPWNVHPDRNVKWREDQDKELGKRLAAQECDCSFISSGDTYFESEDLEYYTDRTRDPIEQRGANRDYWIWEYPAPDRNYMVIVDTAKGDGSDSSVVQVIDVFTGSQVAEYRGDMDTKSLSKFAVSVATDYNSALLVVENTGLGHATISDVLELNYNNIYYSPKGDTLNVSQYINQYYDHDISKMTPGFTTSTETRPEVLLAFKQYVRDHSISLNSRRLTSEMSTFVWKNSKPQAQSGYHDDCVMSYAIGLFLRDSAIHYKNRGMDMQRALLSNIKRGSGLGNISLPGQNKFENPYNMNINGQQEDISWLIR